MLLFAGLSLAWAAEARPSLAADGTSAKASYSIGKSGSRLKWLAQPAQPTRHDSAVRPAQYAEPPAAVRSQPPAAAVPSIPSADEKAAVAAPGELLPEPMPAEPKSARPLPGPGAATAPKYGPNSLPDGLLPLKGPKPSLGTTNELLTDRETKRSAELKETCPSLKDLKHIGDIITNITPPGGELPHDCPLDNEIFRPRCFAPITFSWTAAGLCHKPLYFEDVQLERYGHMCGPWLQPFASGFQFFATIPVLPYEMGIELPGECIYTLGYYRPGDCAPYMLEPIPLSVRAAFFEGCSIVGFGYAFP